ncbi:general stress protein [Macrococcus armenti]|uniref:general stress protein n=1 Tax=Macrococcus armenti TaxID=2875764 RepID=UPI001CCA72BF|nr:general stress protein [Macrococcus armenti]UBH12621.1 general stress protein [Macrococcus armenti]UBH21780.1 general stress protein [Macrococcus armenti]
MRFVETFMSEQPLLGKIEQLKAEGYKEEEMYVLSQNKVEGLAIAGSKANFVDASGRLGDKISSFFTGKSVREA